MSKPQPNQALDTDTAQDPKFASSTLDFLLIELVPLAQRLTEQVHARDQAILDEYRRSRIFNQDVQEASAPSTNGETPTTSIGFPALADNSREALFWRLDGLGYRVGQGLVER